VFTESGGRPQGQLQFIHSMSVDPGSVLQPLPASQFISNVPRPLQRNMRPGVRRRSQPTVDHAETVADARVRTFDGQTDESILRYAANTPAFLEHHLSMLKEEHAEFERLCGRVARWS